MRRENARGADAQLALQAVDVHKRFGRLPVLNGVSLDVRRGETVCVIGPSGSGKSTFLRCVNHFEKIDSGRIEVNEHLIGYRERRGRLVEDSERSIARQRAEIGMVFQRFNLFPHKTALENVIEAPVRVRKAPRADRRHTRDGLRARGCRAHRDDGRGSHHRTSGSRPLVRRARAGAHPTVPVEDPLANRRVAPDDH